MDKYRPLTIEEFCGQKHLVGEHGLIKMLLEKKRMKSLVFYGPSGTGKTTLANIIASTLDIQHGFFNAAINNKKELIILIETAKLYDKFLIVVDEFHRLNKDKQDILLPYLETSNVIVIGITAFNPYHSINPAIRSRLHILEFLQLQNEDIKVYLNNLFKKHFDNYTIDDQVFTHITKTCNGDLRYAINQLETLSIIANNNHISLENFKSLNPQKSLLIDKNSDYYYDLLSAYQKSIRGSDVNASLHYLAQLVNLGDLEIICRRLIVISYEDIGLANPNIHMRIQSAINSAIMVGFPEARIILANAVIELALSPKSNSAYLAIKSAIQDTKQNYNIDVPANIKHHNQGYIYPHDYGGWVKQNYLPSELQNKRYLSFKNNKSEKKLEAFYINIEKLKK